jgi:hypothetical protein
MPPRNLMPTSSFSSEAIDLVVRGFCGRRPGESRFCGGDPIGNLVHVAGCRASG